MSKKEKNNEETENLSGFPAKWRKHLPENFIEKAESMSEDDLKKRLVECERTISSTEKDMENDSKIIKLKEDLAESKLGYSEIIVSSKAVVKFIVYVLNERGTA